MKGLWDLYLIDDVSLRVLDVERGIVLQNHKDAYAWGCGRWHDKMNGSSVILMRRVGDA